MTSTNDSGSDKPKRNNSRRRRPANRKRRSANDELAKPAQQPQAVQGKNRHPQKNKPKNNNSTSSKILKGDEIIFKYDHLLEQHVQARRKYFELFYRKDPRRVEKLERNFQKTSMDIRSFETRLKPWQLEVLYKRTEGYPLDLDYSESSQEKVVDELPTAPFIDIHINASQRARSSYKDDTEESVGSFEDYEKYKELTR